MGTVLTYRSVRGLLGVRLVLVKCWFFIKETKPVVTAFTERSRVIPKILGAERFIVVFVFIITKQ